VLVEKSERKQLAYEAAAATIAQGVGATLPAGIGGLVAAATEPVILRLLENVGAEWGSLRARRATRLFCITSAEVSLSIDELETRISGNEPLVELAAAAAIGAADARYDARIVALGKALASGILAESADAIDQERIFVEVLSALDRPHVRLLSYMVENEKYEGGGPDPRLAVIEDLPDISPVFGYLASALERNYLIEQRRKLKFRQDWKINGPTNVPEGMSDRLFVTDFGRQVLDRLVDAGSQTNDADAESR
jgi:hypothetical protein